jgi:arabinofuranosyltransferase
LILRRIGLLAACVVLLLHAARFFNLADDAYISSRYAENLASGHGLVFNPGERVEGYTDFLWVVLLALCRLAGAPVPLAAQVLGLGFTVLSLFLAAALARRFSQWPPGGAPAAPVGGAITAQKPGLAPGAGVIAALLVAANPAVARWAVGGLEAPLFSFLALASVWCYLRDEATGTVAWRWPAVCFLAALARPDGILFFLVALLFGLGRSRSRGLGMRPSLQALAVFLALGTPYFLWRLWYFGSLLPNTFYAKVVYDAGVLQHGTYYLNYFLFASGGAVILTGALLALRRAHPGVQLASWQAATYTAYVFLVGGDGEPYSRFLAPVAVLLAPAAEAGYRRVGAILALRDPVRAITGSVAVALLCFASAAGSFFGRHHEEYLMGVEAQARRVAIGEWLHRNAPPDAVIALNPVGVIPYLSGLRTIDMLGLTDAHIGRQGRSVVNRVLFAHNRYDPEYVLSRRPDYLIPGQASTFEVKESKPDLRRPGPSRFEVVAPAFELFFPAFPGDAVLWGLPDFRRYYLPTIVETGGRYFYMFVRDRRVEEIEARFRETGGGEAELAALLSAKGAEYVSAPPASADTREMVMQALQQADIERARGDLAAAGGHLQSALAIDPRDPIVLYNLGALYEQMSRQDEALDAYLKALEVRPDFADACNNAGAIYARKGDFVAARRQWERALSIDPGHAARDNLRQLDEREGRATPPR